MRTKEYKAEVLPALASVAGNIEHKVKQSGSFAGVPNEADANVCNQIYFTSEVVRLLGMNETVNLNAESKDNLKSFKKEIDNVTKFNPL